MPSHRHSYLLKLNESCTMRRIRTPIYLIFVFSTIPVFIHTSDEDVDPEAIRRFDPDNERTVDVAQQTLRAMDKSLGRSKCPRVIKDIKSFLLILAGNLRYNTTFQICNNRTTCKNNNNACRKFCTPEELKPDPPDYSSCMYCEVRSIQLRPETPMMVKAQYCVPAFQTKTTSTTRQSTSNPKKISETRKSSTTSPKPSKSYSTTKFPSVSRPPMLSENISSAKSTPMTTETHFPVSEDTLNISSKLPSMNDSTEESKVR